MGLALDLSNYDYDTFDPECLLGSGVTDLFIGCQRPDLARNMIRRAQAAGLPVRAVYAFLYFGLDSIGQTMNAVAVARDTGVDWVTLDVESVPPHERAGITPEERIAELRRCVAYVEDSGLKVIIYTGAWYWPSYMANTTEFSAYPLWHAAYPADGRVISQVSYGGWTDVAIHQYTSQAYICGRNRDANYILIPPWEGSVPFTANHEEMLYGLVDLLIGNPNGIEYVNDIERLIALRAAIANDQRFAYGLGLTQQKVGELAAAVAALSAGQIGGAAAQAELQRIATELKNLGEGFQRLAAGVGAPSRDEAGGN